MVTIQPNILVCESDVNLENVFISTLSSENLYGIAHNFQLFVCIQNVHAQSSPGALATSDFFCLLYSVGYMLQSHLYYSDG